jgi:hypothetical protein
MESAGPSLVLRIVRGVEELSVTVSLAGGTAS